MAYVRQNYEPIVPTQDGIDHSRQLYMNILTRLSEIKCHVELKLAVHVLLHLDSWQIDHADFVTVNSIYEKSRTPFNLIEACERLDVIS